MRTSRACRPSPRSGQQSDVVLTAGLVGYIQIQYTLSLLSLHSLSLWILRSLQGAGGVFSRSLALSSSPVIPLMLSLDVVYNLFEWFGYCWSLIVEFESVERMC